MSSIAALLMNLLLRVLRREFEEETVQSIVVEDVGPIYTSEGVIVLSKGSEYGLPRWVAYELADKGLVEIKDPGITIESLAKITYDEETSIKKPIFVKLPKYFYHMVSSEIDRLYKRLEVERNPMILSDIQKFEDYLMRIGDIRVRKMLQLLFIEPPQDLLAKLSSEEQVLFGFLKEGLRTWLKSLRVEKGG